MTSGLWRQPKSFTYESSPRQRKPARGRLSRTGLDDHRNRKSEDWRSQELRNPYRHRHSPSGSEDDMSASASGVGITVDSRANRLCARRQFPARPNVSEITQSIDYKRLIVSIMIASLCSRSPRCFSSSGHELQHSSVASEGRHQRHDPCEFGSDWEFGVPGGSSGSRLVRVGLPEGRGTSRRSESAEEESVATFHSGCR